MSNDGKDMLAAEYVLGTLGADERQRVQGELSRDPELKQAVENWEERLSPLIGADVGIQPRDAIWENIEATLDPDQNKTKIDIFTLTMRANEGEWEEVMPGISRKVLLVEPEEGQSSFLVRFEPGATFPAHHHNQVEEVLAIEGEIAFGDLVLKAGDYHAASAGTEHPELSSEKGGVLYIRAGVE